MVRLDGWQRHSTWDQSSSLRELYARRCRREEPEMTCHAQAAELLIPRFAPGDVVLDAGCGSGYFFHSLASRGLQAQYIGVDASARLIALGRELMPAAGLPATQLLHGRLEDLDGVVDHVLCINVLTNIDNYHRPLERLLGMARKSLILRESLRDGAHYSWVRDHYLDPGCELGVHVNHYDRQEVMAFIRERGFQVEEVVDRRTQGRPELVIDHPHYWGFLVADRVDNAGD